VDGDVGEKMNKADEGSLEMIKKMIVPMFEPGG